jgi:pimeloyl-ACP methyl ester carboxylesterase
VAGLSSLILLLSIVVLTPVVVMGGFLLYCIWAYAPVIRRIFEERPMFQPLKLTLEDVGEPAEFRSPEGLTLRGSYFKARTDARVGVLVFCHEFLSDRWSYAPYLDHLRDRGFDVFSFDFRSHGESDVDPDYEPLQYASNHEVDDLKAAIAYLRSRSDRDLTDGAFPTRGTMTAYIVRWAEIFVRSKGFLRLVPRFVFSTLGDVSRAGTERNRNCFYPNVERAVAQLSPRPWLQVHGGRDVYIGPDIADEFFAWAREPKEQWMVPAAKHNRCREIAPEAYARRLEEFVDRNAPRRPLAEVEAEAAVDAFSQIEDSARSAAPGLVANVAPVTG